jgi:hypothetical protein
MASVTIQKPMRAATLQGRQFAVLHMAASVVAPHFDAAQVAELTAGRTATDGESKAWRTLGGWLDTSGARVQCRMAGLTVIVKEGVQGRAQLLPLDPSPPKAELVYTVAGAERRRPLLAMLDTGKGELTLRLPFEDTTAGHDLYEEVVSAMTARSATIAAEITGSHAYRTTVTRPAVADAIAQPLRMSDPVMRAQVVRDHRRPVGEVRPMPGGIRVRPGAGRPIQDSPPPRPAPEPESTVIQAALAHSVRIELGRPREDSAVFPDLPRQQAQGWGQLVRPGRPPLFFRGSASAEVFFYLPTRFKLGFYTSDERAAGRPPMRAEHYLDAAGGYRVKVTLVALPHIDDADRDALRTHLRDVELQGMVPFVQLELMAGLKAKFVGSLSAGSAGDQQTLPASIRVTAESGDASDQLTLEFDMEAADYATFCELVRKGMQGRVALEADPLRPEIDVRLRLDDLISNAIGMGIDVADASVPPALVLENLLDVPVQIASGRVSLVDKGTIPGLIFDAEEHDVVSQQRLEPRQTTRTPITPRQIAGWDVTLVTLGEVKVLGGSAEEWLARVHRDPSLQPREFRVKVDVRLPASGADRVQLVRFKLFKDGDSQVRTEHSFVPGSPPWSLAVAMTLAELMGQAGQPPSFSLEFDSLYTDGTLSLPQRLAIRPGMTELPVLALVETPTSTYTVESDGPEGTARAEVDRAGAAALVERLRAEGKRWKIYARQPQPAGETGQTPRTTPEDPPAQTPAGPEVTIVTDLLGERFRTGRLKQVFVTLQAVAEGAPSSTLVFDAQSATGQRWRPTSGTIPPFKYKVVYLYEGDVARQSEGVEQNLVLLLDPPALGT